MKTALPNSSAPRRGSRPLLFVSYRRRFDSASARLLYNEMKRALGGEVFVDVDSIEAGDAFPERIREALERCAALLVLISPGWLDTAASLHDPADFVRHEVAVALARQIPVIPILLGGARMPKAEELPEEIRDLAFRQAIELSDDRWDYDLARLVKLVRARLALSEPPSPFGRTAAAIRSFFGTWLGKAAAVAALIAAILLAATAVLPRAAWYALTRDFEGCVGWYAPDVLSGVERIRPGEYDVPVVRADKYQLALRPPVAPEGAAFIVKIADSGKDVGAVFFRFRRGALPAQSSFTVVRVVAAPCADVQDYRNDSRPAGDKHFLMNWDTMRVTLGERDYYLRPDDSGTYITASLTLTPRQ